jgi:hypothetical protein
MSDELGELVAKVRKADIDGAAFKTSEFWTDLYALLDAVDALAATPAPVPRAERPQLSAERVRRALVSATPLGFISIREWMVEPITREINAALLTVEVEKVPPERTPLETHDASCGQCSDFVSLSKGTRCWTGADLLAREWTKSQAAPAAPPVPQASELQSIIVGNTWQQSCEAFERFKERVRRDADRAARHKEALWWAKAILRQPIAIAEANAHLHELGVDFELTIRSKGKRSVRP